MQIFVTNKQKTEQISDVDGPVRLGRSPSKSDMRRIVIDDAYVSSDQLVVRRQPDGLLSLENLSSRVSLEVEIPVRATILPGEVRAFAAPIRMTVGETIIEFSNAADIPENSRTLQTISHPVLARINAAPFDLDGAPDADTLIRWLETLVTVQRAAAGSDEFFQQTAQAVVELIGLDRGMILTRDDDTWAVIAEHGSDQQPSDFSRKVLQEVVEQKRTFFQIEESGLAAQSLVQTDAVVAAPVFDANGESVIAAVYGARYSRRQGQRVELQPLEAQLVQVLAAAVGAGLARQASEAEAARRQVQFEQFVSPEVARELDRDPQLLEGRDREITALFADIRNFSRLSERIGANRVCELVGCIMDCLTTRVREFQGTTVSYLGDGLLAIWNAPVEQPDHAELGCRAALAMIGALPELNAQWQEIIGGPLGLGVGVNTGIAMVGNTGSRFKPHYGPLGHMVNLASRVEGATKQLGVPVLITGATRERLSDEFATRRLCRVRVVGIVEPVELFELHAESDSETWNERREVYQSALTHYEAGRWAEACRAINDQLEDSDGQMDVPSLTLMGHCIDCLKSKPSGFDGVWNLLSK